MAKKLLITKAEAEKTSYGLIDELRNVFNEIVADWNKNGTDFDRFLRTEQTVNLNDITGSMSDDFASFDAYFDELKRLIKDDMYIDKRAVITGVTAYNDENYNGFTSYVKVKTVVEETWAEAALRAARLEIIRRKNVARQEDAVAKLHREVVEAQNRLKAATDALDALNG